MAMISINGVELPTPTELQVGIFDISKAERNASGNMIIERITTKRKLFFTYSFLTENDAATVLNAISPTFYNVTYINPQTNATETGSFYSGDRNIGFVDYRNGVARYQDLTFNLIEK
jgi:hypothetical protein